MITVDIGQMRDSSSKPQALEAGKLADQIQKIGEIQREYTELNQTIGRLDLIVAELITDIAPVLSKPPVQKEPANTPLPPLDTELGNVLYRLRVRLTDIEAVVLSAISRVEL